MNNVTEIKKRKSRFDETPESTIAQQMEEMNANVIDVSYNISGMNQVIDNEYEEELRFLQEIDSSKPSLDTMLHTSDNLMTIDDVTFISVTENSFVKRLEEALKKNFEYIIRKDAGLLKPKELGAVHLIDKSNKPVYKSISSTIFSINQVQKSGIGSSVQSAASNTLNSSSQDLSPSVYVSQLPKDITEDELEILFSSQGKLKKIKLYKNRDGTLKGDALITYEKPDHAATSACSKLNQLDIGEGFIISVTRADFNAKKSTESPDRLKQLAALLPAECEVSKYPVVLIRNGFHFDRVNTESYLVDIETNMLIECCKHGRVKLMLMLTKDLNLNYKLLGEGTIAVTFEEVESAEKCVQSLQGRRIDDRQLDCLLIDLNQSNHVTNETDPPIDLSNNSIPNPNPATVSTTTSTTTVGVTISKAPVINRIANVTKKLLKESQSVAGNPTEKKVDPSHEKVPVSPKQDGITEKLNGRNGVQNEPGSEVQAAVDEEDDVDAFLNSLL